MQHLQVAVGIAERKNRLAADEFIDGHGLARAVVVVVQLGQAHQHRLAVLHLKFGDEGGADDLLRRNAVDVLRPGAHELDFAARHDVGLEAIAAQVVQQLAHGREGQAGIGLLEARMLCGLDPLLDLVREHLRRHVGMRHANNLQQAFLAGGRQRLAVAFQRGLVGLFRLPFRVLRRHYLQFVHGEDQLEVHRLLAPQGAVVIEHRDAVDRRHVVRPALFGDRVHEVQDGLARRPLVPGRQRRLGVRGAGDEQQRQHGVAALCKADRQVHDGSPGTGSVLRGLSGNRP
ncbi:hypothetical protein D3C72_1408050 [compost metagenome]